MIDSVSHSECQATQPGRLINVMWHDSDPLASLLARLTTCFDSFFWAAIAALRPLIREWTWGPSHSVVNSLRHSLMFRVLCLRQATAIGTCGLPSALPPVAGMMGPFGRDLRSRSLVEREVIKVAHLQVTVIQLYRPLNDTGHNEVDLYSSHISSPSTISKCRRQYHLRPIDRCTSRRRYVRCEFLSSSSSKMTHHASGILQRHCEMIRFSSFGVR